MTRLSWICIALLSGCNQGGVSGGNLATVDGYETAAAHAICQTFTTCGEVSASAENGCEAGYHSILAGTGYSLQDAVAAGRVAYDGDAAQACLSYFSSLTCSFDALGLDSSKCRNIVIPKVQPGGMCLADQECVGGFCARTTGSTGCPGTCTVYIASGADCSAHFTGCAPTQWCDTANGNGVCTDLGAKGAACSYGSCQSGLLCLDDGTGNSTCQPIPAMGQHCSYQCGAGLRCDLGTMTCQPQQKKGSACTDTTDCASGLGCAMSAELSSGTCQPFADLGKPCGALAPCASDATCDPLTNTCIGMGGAGDDCSSASCGTFLICDATTMKCVASSPAGSACTSDDDCETSYCDPSTHQCAIQCN
jgi:hypothetical protein